MHYVVSALEMGELERQTEEQLGVAARIMMEVAGRAVATEAAKGLAAGARIVVAAGPGNNGGDGFVAARALAGLGFEVSVYVFAERAGLKGDAKAAFATLENLGSVPTRFVDDARVLYDFSAALLDAALVIDALLGTGSKGELRGAIADAIDVINDSGVSAIAVDIASGVDADTGAVPSRAVNASKTVTFGFAKRGHYMHPGAECRGTLMIADIGIPAVFADKLGIVVRVVGCDDGPSLLKRRPRLANKGTYGRVVVVAGARSTPGAALLALGGALRAGAGLVTWATDEATVHNALSLSPEVMLRLYPEGKDRDAWLDDG
ncbi:MAG: NAD(P)H-hydrate epimerase, partial [Clostridia bacterium]|nr:NAD(P)H-hydrate epimerase [Deltaproteobacteria bacterium]